MTARLLAAALLLCAVSGSWAESSRRSDPTTLEGEHVCQGTNPDGTPYEGTVRIRLKKGLVLMEWTIGDKKTYGTGLLEGRTLGLALEDGVAIYQIVSQAGGRALVGLWAAQGAESACDEVIFLGETGVQATKFSIEAINGKYLVKRGKVDGQVVTVSGGNVVKRIDLGKGIVAEGLLLGDGFTMITPEGVSVFQVLSAKGGKILLKGDSVTAGANVVPTALVPSD